MGMEKKYPLLYISIMVCLGSVDISLSMAVALGIIRDNPDIAISAKLSIALSYLIGIRVESRVDL